MRQVLVLPVELVVEILKRLPVKFLYQCMSVCRSWNSLITSNHFVSTHLDYQKAFSNGDIVPKTYPFYYHRDYATGGLRFYVFCDDGFTFRQLCEYDDCPDISLMLFVGSCDGMVCLYNYDGMFIRRRRRKWFTLWNPSQKKYIEVYFPHIDDEHGSLCYGFGFDAYRNDYKIVVLVLVEFRRYGIKERCYVCYVYSLRTGFWKRKNMSRSLFCIFSQGAHFEGVIHWAMAGPITGSDLVRPFSILTFNLADETFDKITVPEEFISSDLMLVVPMTVKWHGKDCLSICCKDVTHSWIYLCVMEKYGMVESWKEVAKFSGHDHILDVRMNGEIVLSTSATLVSRDPETKKCELICSKYLSRAGTYVESLVSLERAREALEET